jgi:hypothetical protein
MMTTASPPAMAKIARKTKRKLTCGWGRDMSKVNLSVLPSKWLNDWQPGPTIGPPLRRLAGG